MSVQEGDLRTLLELFPIYELKRMAAQKGLEFKSRKSEDYINKLVEQDWPEKEIQDLRHRLSVLNKEAEPFNRYIFTIDSSLDLQKVRSELSTNAVEYNQNHVPVSGGYELDINGDRLEGTRWRVSEDKEYNRYIDKIVVTPKISAVHFVLDRELDIMFAETKHYQRAVSVKNDIENLGIELGKIGHRHIPYNFANDLVREFVEDLKEKLRERNDDDRSGLEIDEVDMLVERGIIDDLHIGGNDDIFSHDEVERFTSEKEGKILNIAGKYTLNEVDFEFEIGYGKSLDIGKIRVKKLGKKQGSMEPTHESYNILYEVYRDYYIDVE